MCADRSNKRIGNQGSFWPLAALYQRQLRAHRYLTSSCPSARTANDQKQAVVKYR